MSNFFTLNIARRAMQVSTKALEISAHNVANANTPGFSRQRGVIQTTPPHLIASRNMPPGPGQVGTGVEVAEIIRVRSEMLDLQVRGQTTALGFWEAKQEAVSYLSGVYMEPSENGLNTAMERFWASWQEVAKNPTSEATRTSLLESAISLSSSFHSLSVQTTNLLEDLNNQVVLKVDEVNNIASSIAQLNVEIASARAVGYNPNDLMDKRDLLLDQLSRLADVRIHHLETGAINVSLGGKVLVQNTKVFTLEAQNVSGKMVPVWQRDGSSMSASQGELAGLAEVYDYIRDEVLGRLNELARTLADEVNALHTSGYDRLGNPGGEFFHIPAFATGQEAAFISLAPALENNPHLVAATSDPAVTGGNDIAQAIANLRNETPMSGGLATFYNFFNGLVTDLGFEVQTSARMVSNHEIMLEHSETRRQSESGVSIDEEVTFMLQFQHTYQAAAQLISTVNTLLGTLINEMGRY